MTGNCAMRDNREYQHITIKPLHPTIGAEITGVDFAQPVSREVLNEILSAITRYGVLVFRKTCLTDESHIAFAKQFGELDDITPYIKAGRPHRLKYEELFDVSNVEMNGEVLDPDTPRGHANRGNSIFHVDSSFNPRRAGYSLLLAHQLPPPGNGGQTAFADTRAAFDDLPPDLKDELKRKNYVAAHSMHHSRKLASPEYFADLNPLDHPMGRHRLVQVHEPSGRDNLYMAAHVHHIEGLRETESQALINRLFQHAAQEKYVVLVEWENAGDLVIWDNTCTMHRSVGGPFMRKFKRDMRRATVHDSSSHAWGLNERTNIRVGMP